MKDILVNKGWTYSKLNENNFKEVYLPHDAMIYENIDITSKGGKNISYFLGFDYEYHKELVLTNEDLNSDLFLMFEGIYQSSEIFINDELAYKEEYGYNTFYFQINKFIKEGTNNIKVIAYNSNQPNSRWYSGSGIYRNVHLIYLPKNHILFNGVKFNGKYDGSFTLDIESNFEDDVKVEIFDEETLVYSTTKKCEKSLVFEDKISNVKPWNVNNPHLYNLKVTLGEDERNILVGFRTIELSLEKGLLINGEREILYGACIHHDNGILGAVENKLAAYRKVKKLKEAGYNAIRSAHNPASIDILEACDKLGLYVLDEYVDCWFMHKTKYDYALHATKNYKNDISLIVQKDYNHPSVIMYSTGNEVGESSSKKGISFGKDLTDAFHEFDNSRPVTCGINIFFNLLAYLGLGVYSDKKSEKEAIANQKVKKKSVGSEFFNDLAGKLGANFMKTCATLPPCDWTTKGVFSNLDIAGYNYGIKRYKHDLRKYPTRFILGSETFCSDAGYFYNVAKKNPRLLGDFVWAGFDYLGEVGVGSWTSKEYCDNDFSHLTGWLTAGSGRIDITGRFNSEVDITKVCFEQKQIAIGVHPVNHFKSKHSASAWKCSLGYPIYNYPGYENQQTIIEVYSKAPKISLYLDDKLLQTKKCAKSYITKFLINYKNGTIKAVGKDKRGNVLCETSLSSGKGDARVVAEIEDNIIESNYRYVNFKIMDDIELLPAENTDLEILNVENGSLEGLGNGCSYTKFPYKGNKTFFFYGMALAIVKINDSPAKITYKTKFGTNTIEVK